MSAAPSFDDSPPPPSSPPPPPPVEQAWGAGSQRDLVMERFLEDCREVFEAGRVVAPEQLPSWSRLAIPMMMLPESSAWRLVLGDRDCTTVALEAFEDPGRQQDQLNILVAMLGELDIASTCKLLEVDSASYAEPIFAAASLCPDRQKQWGLFAALAGEDAARDTPAMLSLFGCFFSDPALPAGDHTKLCALVASARYRKNPSDPIMPLLGDGWQSLVPLTILNPDRVTEAVPLVCQLAKEVAGLPGPPPPSPQAGAKASFGVSLAELVEGLSLSPHKVVSFMHTGKVSPLRLLQLVECALTTCEALGCTERIVDAITRCGLARQALDGAALCPGPDAQTLVESIEHSQLLPR